MIAKSVSYFIYYKVRADRLDGVLPLVASMQREVQAASGIAGRILCKDDDPDTWMEIYDGVPDVDRIAFEKILDAAVARSGFATLLDKGSQRHVERFVGERTIDAA